MSDEANTEAEFAPAPGFDRGQSQAAMPSGPRKRLAAKRIARYLHSQLDPRGLAPWDKLTEEQRNLYYAIVSVMVTEMRTEVQILLDGR